MSQNSIQLPTSGTLGGLQGISDINAALDTLNTKWAGASAPAAAEFGQSWIDTSTTPNSLKIYDGSQWVAIGTLDGTNHLWLPPAKGGVTLVGSITLDVTYVGRLISNNAATGVITTFPLASTIPAGQRLRFQQQYSGGSWTLSRNGTDTLQGADGWGATTLTLLELGAYVEFESDGGAHWYQVNKIAPFASVGATQAGMDAGSIVTPAGLASILFGGPGQLPVNVTSGRSLNTTYTNSTGRVIFCWVAANAGPNASIGVVINGIQIGMYTNTGNNTASSPLFFAVPAGVTYECNGTGVSFSSWWEMR